MRIEDKTLPLVGKLLKASEYDQEMPQTQTADHPVVP